MTFEDLMNAAKDGDTATMLLILDKDLEMIHAKADNGETPLMAALYHGKTKAVELLLNRGVSLNIHEAAAIGDEEYIQYLLETDASLLSAYSYDGWTPLHLAAFFGGYHAAECLIEHGADVNAVSTNKMANSPIHAATAGRKFNIVQLLLEKGADANKQQQGGWTPLHQAVANWDMDMVKLLLSFNADPNIAQNEGKTAKALAAEKEFHDIVQLFAQNS